MFIIQLRNGDFAVMKSNAQSSPTIIVVCESYDAAMEMKLDLEG